MRWCWIRWLDLNDTGWGWGVQVEGKEGQEEGFDLLLLRLGFGEHFMGV